MMMNLASAPLPSAATPAPLALSVVIPALNERERLPQTLQSALAYLRQSERTSWEVIVVDDGSDDGTAEYATSVVRGDPERRLRVLRSPKNIGKGAALAAGTACARGERLLFMDADGGTPITALPALEDCMLRSGGGLVVGARSFGRRSWFRQLMGVVFHSLASTCVSGVADTQCGFKLLTRAAALSTMPHLRVRRWAYDVELLYLAQAQGIGVASTAVPSIDMPGSKIRWSTPIQMLRDVLMVSLLYRLRVWRLPHLDHGQPSPAADGTGESGSSTEISLPLDEGIADDLDRYVEITAAE